MQKNKMHVEDCPHASTHGQAIMQTTHSLHEKFAQLHNTTICKSLLHIILHQCLHLGVVSHFTSLFPFLFSNVNLKQKLL